MFNHLA
jgi:hypothetical protein